MPDKNIKMHVLSGSPELTERIPKTPPEGIFPPESPGAEGRGRAPHDAAPQPQFTPQPEGTFPQGSPSTEGRGRAPHDAAPQPQFTPTAAEPATNRGRKSPAKLIAVCLAAVVVVGAAVFLARNWLGSGDSPESPGTASSTGAQPQSPSGGGGGLFGGSGGGGGDNALYQGSGIGTDGHMAQIGGKLYWQTMQSMYRLDGAEMVKIRSETSNPVLAGVLCVNGDLYYPGSSSEYTLMRAPGGDFGKEEGVYAEKYHQMYTDGVSIFLRNGDDTCRMDCKTLEVTPISNVMSAQPFMAHDGVLYGRKFEGKTTLWFTQDYQGSSHGEISSTENLDDLAAGTEGVAAISREGGLYRIAGGGAELLISAEEISARIGAEVKLDSSNFAMDGAHLYFIVDISGASSGGLPNFYRYNMGSGALQGIPIPDLEFNSYFKVLNSWVSTRDNLYRLEEGRITESVLLSQEHDSRGVRQDNLVYEKTEIELIDF